MKCGEKSLHNQSYNPLKVSYTRRRKTRRKRHLKLPHLPPTVGCLEMEFFNKAKIVRLRSHSDKYLCADEDKKTVRQSRNGTSSKVRWTVEFVPGTNHIIRLKSCHGLYLTASDEPFLLGMTGNKVVQTLSNLVHSSLMEWEPIRDGFEVKLRTRGGQFLRANGSTPPWRNSITHDSPHGNATKDWALWDVEMVDVSRIESFQSQASLSSSLSEVDDLDSPASPWSTASPKLSMTSPSFSSSQLGMEFFRNAKAVRLKSYHDKYLLADEDDESVSQDRNGSSKAARWTVEFIPGESFIRLKSSFNQYLTASNSHFLLGMTGRKVLQTLPKILDSSHEWEPIRDGNSKVKLKTRHGNYLRANGSVPPWRNSVTHDVPHRTSSQDCILWEVDVLEIQVQVDKDPPKVVEPHSVDDTSSETSESSTPSFKPRRSSSKFKSSDSSVRSLQKAVDGRIIHYIVTDDLRNVDDSMEEVSFPFKGNGVYELTQMLEQVTGIEDIIVCTRSPLNGKLYPLRLQLPPNNSTMHVVVVPSFSKVAKAMQS